MKRWVPLCALLAILFAACGDDAAEPAPTTAAGSTTAATTTAASTTTPAATTTTGAAIQPPRDVAFPTADGLTLEGRLFPAGATWVILAHMFPADMASWFEFAAAAQQAGYSALAYNNRGYGGSDPGDPLDVGADALAAISFARADGAARVFFFGASMNGAAALFAGAQEDLAGIASLSGVPEWDNTPGLGRAGEVTEPALFVAAEDDGNAVATAEAMAEAVAGDSQVQVFPTGGHGTGMFRGNPGLTDFLLDFIRQHS
jgi:pimeloyl-ACP methyl ester carboxylesterase